MNKILLVFVLVGLTACATNKTGSIPETDPVRVVTIEAEAEDIYRLSKQWIIENFQSTKNVIVQEDKSANRLIANGALEESCMVAGGMTRTKKTCDQFNKPLKPLDFVIQIDAADGSMRYEVSAFAFDGGEVTYHVLQRARYEALGFAQDIKEYVHNNL